MQFDKVQKFWKRLDCVKFWLLWEKQKKFVTQVRAVVKPFHCFGQPNQCFKRISSKKEY
jgi:hypothetical protein